MSEYRKVAYRVERGIARITLNRPERRNALDQELLSELRDALRVSVVARGKVAAALYGNAKRAKVTGRNAL